MTSRALRSMPSFADFLRPMQSMRVLMGLTDGRKTVKNLVDSRKNWKISTVNRK